MDYIKLGHGFDSYFGWIIKNLDVDLILALAGHGL